MYVPLQLSFARTLHTTEGAEAGPDEEGKPPHTIKKIILDPGSRKFEQMNPGSLYVGLTRGTTMGDETRMNSAIYFCGDNITPERMINMTRVKGGTGRTTLNIQRRNKWMEHLINNTHQFHCTQPEERELINWAKREKYTQIQLYDIIKNSSIASDVP